MIFALLAWTPPARAYTLTSGGLVEDFTTLDGADLTATTGVWNIVDTRAQAGVVANGTAANTISFGDGSDGALSASSGTVTFNTDLRPNGFNYTAVSIGAGATIAVTGSNPLIIRSLTTVNISPTISLNGNLAAPGNGVANGVTTAPTGGTVRGCSSTAGAGGVVNAGPAAADGGNGTNSTGASEGNQGIIAAPDGSAAITSALGQDFYAGGFVCGGGGGGGASRIDGGTFATGAGGGAGGGALRITALGNLTVGTITALGGDGGLGISDGTVCSGHGGGGAGGAAWLQTAKTLTTGATPLVTAGTGGAGGGCGGGSGVSFDGDIRGDSAAGSRPVWAGVAAANNTDNAASGNQTYIIQSRAYDLGTFNASFGTPVVASTIVSNGTVNVTYATSADGASFETWASNLSSLSGKGHRYLKFRITIATATAAAASSSVSRVTIPFSDLGPGKVEATLSTGCTFLGMARHRGQGGSGGDGDRRPLNGALFLLTLAMAYGALRAHKGIGF